MELPRHSGDDDHTSVQSSRSRAVKIAVVVAVAALLLVLVLLHVTGVIHGH